MKLPAENSENLTKAINTDHGNIYYQKIMNRVFVNFNLADVTLAAATWLNIATLPERI